MPQPQATPVPPIPAPTLDELTRASNEDELRYPPCTMCGRILTRRHSYYSNRPQIAFRGRGGLRNICPTCFPTHYYRCNECGRAGAIRFSVELFTIPVPRQPNPIAFRCCKRCAERRSAPCANCGDSIRIENLTQRLCPHCLNANIIICTHCHRRFNRLPEELVTECNRCLTRPRLRPSPTFTRNPFPTSVGIELEFCLPTLPPRFDVSFWGSLTGDPSVRPQGLQSGDGREFRSHIYNGDLALDQFAGICRYLRRQKAYVNPSCGFHAHLGVRDLTDSQRENIRAWWERFEYVWFSFVPATRHDNRYCRKQGQSAFDARYYALNTSLARHGTFECRLHPGTLDVSKTVNWVLALLYFFHAAKDIPCEESCRTETRAELIAFFRFTKLPFGLRKYLVSRARHFAHVALVKAHPRRPVRVTFAQQAQTILSPAQFIPTPTRTTTG